MYAFHGTQPQPVGQVGTPQRRVPPRQADAGERAESFLRHPPWRDEKLAGFDCDA